MDGGKLASVKAEDAALIARNHGYRVSIESNSA